MTRYDINETAVYTQVRTVVWEDGVARPLLPDPLCPIRYCARAADATLRGRFPGPNSFSS
jgi:hypothetical protein